MDKNFEEETFTDETEELSDESEKVNENENAPTADVEIAGIKFKKSGKTYYFAPVGYMLKEDDRVIVDTSRGQEYGYVAVPNKVIKASDVVLPLRSVVRMATPEDTVIHEENIKKEIDAFNTCIALIDEHKLQMKLIDVEFTFDRSKLLFYFSSEDRVDFRELVRDLAGIFHTRIEMRQIGIRDEAKMLGGLGICGRPFCCSSFLTDFVQVSVKMAKEQGLSINSAKISGACGRLMCCLRYEYDTYLSEKALTPKVDAKVMTPDGPGVVTDANPLAGIVKVRLDAKPEDSDPVIFVREDVVKIENYNGETLTKTAIPNRSHKNEEEKNLFGEVVVIESPETISKTEETENKFRHKNDQSIKKYNDRKEKEQRREEMQNPEEINFEKADGQNTKTEERRRHRDDRNRNFKGGEHRKKEDGNRPQNQQNQNRSKQQDRNARGSGNGGNPEHNENGEGQQNKKKFRPYYKNFKKKKGNGGNPEGHAGQ